jgi:hypothetical protein
LISGLALLVCLADLETVILALVASRILIQFIGQIATVVWLRIKSTGPPPRYRMPFYPLPLLVALGGWVFVFLTSERLVLAYAIGSILLGWLTFLVWDGLAGRVHRDAVAATDGGDTDRQT